MVQHMQTTGEHWNTLSKGTYYGGCGIKHEAAQFKTIAECLDDAEARFNAAELEAETFVQAEEGDWDNWQVPPSFSMNLSFHFDNDADTKAFVAQFPKFVRISEGQWVSSDGTRGTSAQFSLGFNWKPADKKNETGRKRFNRFVKVMMQEWA